MRTICKHRYLRLTPVSSTCAGGDNTDEELTSIAISWQIQEDTIRDNFGGQER
jgi:hypothetical protein